jgi:hypothetical protein
MIFREISNSWAFLVQNGIKKSLFAKQTPILIQFAKYGFCGIISVILFFFVAKTGEFLWPENYSTEIAESQRARNLFYIHLVAFLPSNFAAYSLNRWFVFTPGRHQLKKELGLFTIISFLSFALGEILPVYLVTSFNIPNDFAHLSFVVSSALINFICRKFLVFQK